MRRPLSRRPGRTAAARLTITWACLLLAGASTANPAAQRAALRETPGAPANAPAAAPADVLAALRTVLTYVSRERPDIATDAAAQARWLSPALRERLLANLAACEARRKAAPDEKIDLPSNADFVGSWDPPSTWTVAASRAYAEQVVIDVRYAWGPDTNYPGDTRLSSFVFVRHDGRWLLDDIYTFRGRFIEAGSLSASFEHPTC